jgi:hypothetical protein
MNTDGKNLQLTDDLLENASGGCSADAIAKTSACAEVCADIPFYKPPIPPLPCL